jgi:DNA-directed RNA polymerase subunit RPC12/RpoP
MTAMTLEGHSGTTVNIDLCGPCQALWFDQHESLQLTPGATLKLFGIIGDHANTPKARFPDVLRCPCCASRLLPVRDRQRNTPFRYWRCDRDNGRFIAFFEFLREKNFIRALSPEQLAELRRNVATLNCSNCGAPIDLAHASACPHCGSPVSMLDMKQAGQLVEQLKRAAEPRPIDPTLPMDLAKARAEVEALFATTGGGASWTHDVSASGLVEAGLSALSAWLKKSV